MPFLRPHSFPSGPTCSEELTACHSGPCLNGGSCSPSPGGYSCTCPRSHTGPRCQTSTDHCASGEYLPCSGAGPQVDGGTGQGVLVPSDKNQLATTSCSFDGGSRECCVCPVRGVTKVTGQVWVRTQPLTASSLQPRASMGLPV